jgi:hypothetical protein
MVDNFLLNFYIKKYFKINNKKFIKNSSDVKFLKTLFVLNNKYSNKTIRELFNELIKIPLGSYETFNFINISNDDFARLCNALNNFFIAESVNIKINIKLINNENDETYKKAYEQNVIVLDKLSILNKIIREILKQKSAFLINYINKIANKRY